MTTAIWMLITAALAFIAFMTGWVFGHNSGYDSGADDGRAGRYDE